MPQSALDWLMIVSPAGRLNVAEPRWPPHASAMAFVVSVVTLTFMFASSAAAGPEAVALASIPWLTAVSTFDNRTAAA